MEPTLAPINSLQPVYYAAPPKPRSTLGSLAVAMLIGALIAVSFLYYWGSNLAKDRDLVPALPEPSGIERGP